MAFGFNVGTVAGIASAVGTIGSVVSGLKAASATEKAAEAQQQATALARRQSELASARERRAAIRERRLAAARNQASAVAQGLQGSSVISGIQGALNTNFASNLAFLDQATALSTMQANFLDQAQFRQAQASIFGAQGRLAGQVGATALDIFKQTPQASALSNVLFGASSEG